MSTFREEHAVELLVLEKLERSTRKRGSWFLAFKANEEASTVKLAGQEYEAGEFKILADSFLVKPDDQSRGLWVTEAGQLAIGLMREVQEK